MAAEILPVRYMMLFCLVSSVIIACCTNTASAGALNYSTLNGIMADSTVNATVASYITSNYYVSNYLIGNPTTLVYFLDEPAAVSSVLSSPAMSKIGDNGIALEDFLSNPSFGVILSNYSQFDEFIGNASIARVTGNPVLLSALLSNPSLASLSSDPSGLHSIISSNGFAYIARNNAAYYNLLSNPSLYEIASNGTQFISFLNSPSSSSFTEDQEALAYLASNPTLPAILSSAQFQTFIESPGSSALLSSQDFSSFTANPAFITFLMENSSSLDSVLADPAQLTGMLSNPSISAITSSPLQTASLLSNPNIGCVMYNQQNLSALLSSNGFALHVMAYAGAFSNFLENPSLCDILKNTTGLNAFVSANPSSLFDNPEIPMLLFGNPDLGTIVEYPAGFSSLVDNASTESMFSNQITIAYLLTSPSLSVIVENAQHFEQVAGASRMPAIMSNATEASDLIGNPSLGNVLSSPGAFGTFLGYQGLGTITGNSSELGSLIGNPSLATIISEPSQFYSFMQSPEIYALFYANGTSVAVNYSEAFDNLLGNPSLAYAIGNPSQFSSLLDNQSMSDITSNQTLLSALMANPSLSYIMQNPLQFYALLENQSLYGITSNPGLLLPLLSNPSINTIMADPGIITGALADGSVSAIFSSANLSGSLLSNPSLGSILQNQASMARLDVLASGGQFSNFSSSQSFSALLSNPSLASILDNASQFARFGVFINSQVAESAESYPSFSSLVSNMNLASFVSNPSIGSITGNPATASILSDPSFTILLNSSGIGGLLSNPSLSSLLSNPFIAAELTNGQIYSFLGSSVLAGVMANTQLYNLSELLGDPGTGTCTLDTTFLGVCGYTNIDAVETIYTGVAGNGKIEPISLVAQSSPTPLINTVLQTNEQDGQWLITCPVTPNPQNSVLYFTTDSGSFIAGNRCLAYITPLVTLITLDTGVIWTPVTPAIATSTYTVTNMASGFVSDIAYSGETVMQGATKYNISNGYSTKSYIFDQVPASTQHGLWTWSAEYADLDNVDLSSLEVDQSYSNLQFIVPFVCDYTYDYSVHSAITHIGNTNITVPQFNRSALSKNIWLNFSNYLYSPLVSEGQGSCYTSLLDGIGCGGWTKIGENASLDLKGSGGGEYNGLNVYYGSSGPSSNPTPSFKKSILVAYPEGLEEANAIGLNYTNVNAVPYLTYNTAMPSSYTQLNSKTTYLNGSFNLYSTHNYLNPGNSLDEFALYTDSNLWASYNGYLNVYPINVISVGSPDSNSLALGQGNFLSDLTAAQAKKTSFGIKYNGKIETIGTYAYGPVVPSYIAASPNGYVYVIGLQTTCGWFCAISSKTTAYLYTFKYVPQGYFNLTNYQPSSQANGATNGLKNWMSEWENYYANAFLQGSSDLYIIGIDKLASVSTDVGIPINNGGAFHSFKPIAAQADSNGNLYLIGVHDQVFGGSGFELAGLLPPGSRNYIENDSVDKPAGFVPSYEFAVSPDGEFVYAANASYSNPQYNPQYGYVTNMASIEAGEVEVYKTSPLGSEESGRSSNAFTYAGNIPLDYSNATYNLNIVAYLANGGPYNDSKVSAAYKSDYQSGMVVNDIPLDHSPISIVDSDGILYVIDNWSFVIGTGSQSAKSAILMLRAFSENGTELPIDPTMYYDYVNTITGSNVPLNVNSIAQGWKPYGWPLSATISLPQGGTISYCAAYCTYGPFSANSGYAPIGPRIDPEGFVGTGTNSLSISADFNGTLYLIAHSWQYQTSSGAPEPEKPLYSELLVLHPNLQNYTSLSYLANSSDYVCYLNVSPGSDNPCIYNSNTKMLQYMYPPILGIPNAFGYVESLGSPEQYLNLQNALSSAFPTGVNSMNYGNAANEEIKNGITGAPNYNTLVTGSYSGNPPTGNVPSTFLKSTVTGYVVTPYNITVVLNQSWQDIAAVPIPPNFFCPPLSLIVGSVDNGKSVKTYFNYQVTKLSDSSGPLNLTIEGGDPYLQYLPQQTNYIQNISDGGLIISPYLNYEIYSNRLFGETYVNQTISPQTATSSATSRPSPVVLNASHSYSYQQNNFEQVSLLSASPAYTTQESIPSVNFGADCGGFCPPNYYYSAQSGISTSFGNSNANFIYYNDNISQFFELFELFKRTYYLGNMVLNFTGGKAEFGYNRLVYTYVDRFNNTIYMPVDVDFANITQLSLNDSLVISPSNPNQTSVTVQGSAYYITPTGTHPVPSGSPIYLYWDDNINYYNITSSSTSDPTGYYTNALLCAIAPSTKNCVLANPLSTQTQQQPSGAQEASAVSFHTVASSSGTGCPAAANSLLQPIVYNCNIYGSNGLTAVRLDPSDPSAYQYCLPSFTNGTGQFTSQLGLIGVVDTSSNGVFTDTFNACGVGQDRVIAQYYGNNQPEPMLVSQTYLAASASNSEFGSKINPNTVVKYPEYDYSDAPNATTTQFEIGTYALGYGAVNAAELILTAATVLIIMFGIDMKRARKPKAR
ncbi:MAG: hypothetical protein ACREBH_02195 [Candidatus Micrarchaeaceae archaeon]